MRKLYTYNDMGFAKPVAWWKYPFIWLWETRKK